MTCSFARGSQLIVSKQELARIVVVKTLNPAQTRYRLCLDLIRRYEYQKQSQVHAPRQVGYCPYKGAAILFC